MIHYKLFQWRYGVVLSLTCGLTGCFIDEPRSGQEPYASKTPMPYEQTSAPQTKAVGNATKSYASKDPVQKSTPGPKRAAAPQIPVIQ